MQTNWGAALLTLALWALCSPGLSTEGKRKLQIGVKKRVDNCPIKSRKGDVLHMHYTGKLEDGTEFDSSLTRDQPFIFSLGTGQVIKGWEQGLLGLWRSGSTAQNPRYFVSLLYLFIYLPSRLRYFYRSGNEHFQHIFLLLSPPSKNSPVRWVGPKVNRPKVTQPTFMPKAGLELTVSW
uniref:peptidylprolyl isomerase n=1 Tax=Naja naja TaxID=35670 RepID=A0A8C6XDJ8_NAJNA